MAGRRAPRSLPGGERQECLGSAFLESTHPSPPLLWVSLRSLQPPDSGQRKEGGGHPFTTQRPDGLRKGNRGISVALPWCV